MTQQLKFYRTKEFQELNTEWQQVLKESGFEDIEEGHVEGVHLKNNTKIDTRNSRFKSMEQTLEYFADAAEYLRQGEFSSERERAIWEMHVDGDTLAEIATSIGTSKSTIFYTVKKIRKRANLRK